jgi:hypothetical protein
LDRCRPLNQRTEALRVSELWARNQPQNPAWVYASPPDFRQLRVDLASVASGLACGDEVDRLYAARAEELELEARISEAVGSAESWALSRLRYPIPSKHTHAERARAWARIEPVAAEADAIPSHCADNPSSLLRQTLAEVARQKLPISVVLKEDLQSVAATTSESVLIKVGVLLTPREARRIVMHELLGHVLPRHNARAAPLGLFRVGSAGSADDEEGRALSIERRLGLFGRERQAELGRRHLAALCVAEGADWVETVRLLVDLGTPVERALPIVSRAQRGGGLAREIVYLPALERVERAFTQKPELERWLGAGRLSLEAARVLARVWPDLVSQAGSALVPKFHE